MPLKLTVFLLVVAVMAPALHAHYVAGQVGACLFWLLVAVIGADLACSN